MLARALRMTLVVPYALLSYPLVALRRALIGIRHDPRYAWRTFISPELLVGGFLGPGDVRELRRLSIGAVVITLVMVTLTSVLRSSVNTVAAGQANDNAAFALDIIQRQVVNSSTFDTEPKRPPLPDAPVPPNGMRGSSLMV